MSMDELRNFNLEPEINGIVPRVTEAVVIDGEKYIWAVPSLHPYPLTEKAVEKLKSGDAAKESLRADVVHKAVTYNLSDSAQCELYSKVMRGMKIGWAQLVDRDRWQDDGKVFVYIEFFLTFYNV